MSELTKKSLQDYFSGLVVTVKAQFALMKTTFKEEAIHDFRVALKKYRTLQRFLDYVQGSDHMPLGQPLKKLFRLSGALRDVQVKKNLIVDTQGTGHIYYKYLHLLEIRARIDLKKFIGNVLPQQIEESMNRLGPVLMAYNENNLKKDAFDFSFKKIQTVQQSYHRQIGRGWMHQCRKDLKDAYYTLSMLQTISTLSPQEEKLLEKTTVLQELYGIWHDWELTLEHLEDFEKIKKEYRSFIGMR